MLFVRKIMNYIEHKKLKELKQDILNWEIWFNSKYKERHYCENQSHRDELEFRDAAILKSDKNEHGVSQWNLLKVWLADKEEVADGEADIIGEVLKASSIVINYCPICGKELP